ncbi:hypothetical protein Tco_0668144 [Tanacetum coccineum]
MGDPEADVDNEVLKDEQGSQVGKGSRVNVTILPTLIINDVEYRGTDIAKISRKRSKPDKHGHGNGIECARARRMLSKVNKSQPMVNSGQP